MRFRVNTWRQVLAISAVITALAVAVPLVVVGFTLWRVPLQFKIPIFVISGLIPLFITFPISVFALHMLKLVSQTITTLDSLVKFDTLTGLLSRVRFLQLMEEQRINGGYLAILDADHFKCVNDTYGHEAGDEVLKHIATLMTLVVGNHGFVGRLGGEEFAIYLPGVTQQQAQLVIAQTCSALRLQSIHYRGTNITATISAGLVSDNSGEAMAVLLRRADQFLYLAKQKGRDRFECDVKLDERAVSAA